MGILTSHKKKNFSQGTLIAILCNLYVDDGAFPFEDRNQLTQELSLIFSHFTIFGIKMHIGKGGKAFKTECVFFPPPGFLNGNAS